MPNIEGISIVDEDLLTVVAVNDADPSLKNKKFRFDELVIYLDQYFQNQNENTFSGDIIIGGNAIISGLTTSSGIVVTNAATVSGLTVQNNAIVSGTISGDVISGDLTFFNQSEIQLATVSNLSGVSFTYETGTVTSFFSGAVITGDTINATNIEATNLRANTLSGATVTGISGVFTNLTAQESTFTNTNVDNIVAGTGVFQDLTVVTMTLSGNQRVSGNLIVDEDTFLSGLLLVESNITGESSLYIKETGYIENIVTSGTISGAEISGVSGVYTYLSGQDRKSVV